jgi:phosphohistidine phosphatase SixA
MQMPGLLHGVRSTALAVALTVSACATAFGQGLAGGELISSLRQGGYVLVMRHANSPQISPDASMAAPGNVRLERQLNENGHRTARAMGEAVRTLGVPIGDVLSSPTFRTRETVQGLGLGTAKLFNELGDGSSGYEISSIEDGATFLRARAAESPRTGTNTLIVTHLPNLANAFGNAASNVAEGEAIIFRPDGKTATEVARIKIDEWPRLSSQRQ